MAKIKGLYRGYSYDDKSLEIPNNFDEMKFIATELSTNFKFVRVDLYNHLGEILFGEMTFLPASGFQKFSIKKYDYEFGKTYKNIRHNLRCLIICNNFYDSSISRSYSKYSSGSHPIDNLINLLLLIKLDKSFTDLSLSFRLLI